jgi:protoporphyrinogen oxidase
MLPPEEDGFTLMESSINFHGRQALKIGLLRLRRSLLNARKGGRSVAEVLPHEQIANAMTLGIVNDVAANVDADFLFPSMTKFGINPPVKWSKIKKEMRTRHILSSRLEKGSVASLAGGMKTLIDTLHSTLENMSNVSLRTGFHASSPEVVASEFNQPQSSIIWTVPSGKRGSSTSLSIYAIGYRSEDVSHVRVGYGTLIPDERIPISGILHESDVHSSQRAPTRKSNVPTYDTSFTLERRSCRNS